MGITGIPGIRLGIAWGAAPTGIPGRMGIPVPMGIPGIPGIGPAPGIENDAPCRVLERELGSGKRGTSGLIEGAWVLFLFFLWEAGGKPPDPQLNSGLAGRGSAGSAFLGGREGARAE